MENRVITWLKRIFRVSSLTAIATIIGTSITIIEYVERNDGELVAFVNNTEATSPTNRNILIYMDEDSVDLSQIGILPTMTNPSKYSIQDILLTYKIDVNFTNVSYTDYYSIHRIAKGNQITNNDKTLYAKTTMPEPFYSFVMYDNGDASINLEATYKGIDEPFTYQAYIKTKKISKNDNNSKSIIYADAYDYLTTNHIDTIDIFIQENNEVISLINISLNEIKRETQNEAKIDSNEEETSKPKEYTQIQSERDNLIKEAQKNYSAPWYMYIAAGVLFIFLFLLLYIIILLFLWIKYDYKTTPKSERVFPLISFILIIIITYLPYYYLCHIGNIINNHESTFFGAILGSYMYIWFFMFFYLVISVVFEKLIKKITHKDKDYIYTSGCLLFLILFPLWFIGLVFLFW